MQRSGRAHRTTTPDHDDIGACPEIGHIVAIDAEELLRMRGVLGSSSSSEHMQSFKCQDTMLRTMECS